MELRLAAEDGFTLLERGIVLTIVAVLLTIPISSYLTFSRRANDATAKANVHIVSSAIEAYYDDHDSYDGMTLATLGREYDTWIEPSKYSLSDVTETSYCVSSTSGRRSWKREGPGTKIVRGKCT
jgi:Tfp pilus assembly protein PilE